MYEPAGEGYMLLFKNSVPTIVKAEYEILLEIYISTGQSPVGPIGYSVIKHSFQMGM